MRFVSVKTASDVKLDGVKVEFDIVNDAVKSATLIDGKGNLIRVTSPYSSVQIEIKAPPKTKEQFVLRASIPGFEESKIEKGFDSKFEAEQAERDLPSGVDSTITKENVVIKDDVSSDTPF